MMNEDAINILLRFNFYSCFTFLFMEKSIYTEKFKNITRKWNKNEENWSTNLDNWDFVYMYCHYMRAHTEMS